MIVVLLSYTPPDPLQKITRWQVSPKLTIGHDDELLVVKIKTKFDDLPLMMSKLVTVGFVQWQREQPILTMMSK